ncbi:MAG: hypothetical protein JWL77_3059 [Chthonomonadaceae bacterium]|nr:hypothetical protein [Chthonomonadaceae bacterium]
MQALLELDCIPAGMELFPASDEDQWSLIKRVIDDCDYYIVIIGGRYGSLAPNGKSYTHMEYEYAVSTGKPVIGFIHKDPGSISAAHTESSDSGKAKLSAFRTLVQQKMCKMWESRTDLGGMVSRSMIQLIKAKPAVGWMRADKSSQEDLLREINELRKENLKLKARIDLYQQDALPNLENIAGLDENFDVHIDYLYDPEGSGETTGIAHVSVQISWNDLFALIAPFIELETQESSVAERIATYFFNREDLDGFHPTVDEQDFETIRIQFQALGLITRTLIASTLSVKVFNWCLTPKGKALMWRLRTVRSSLPSHAEIPF